MPELPEVETVVRTLRPALQNAAIGKILHLRPDILLPKNTPLPRLLHNRQIHSIDRRGKRILITLDNQTRLLIHLGMTGRLTLSNPNDPIPPHTHFILQITPPSQPPAQLRFRDPRRFGELRWLANATGHEDLGPEPLTLQPADLIPRLKKTRRPIKSALLDQRLIAGLGNIYADEALFVAKIHPTLPANLLTPAQVTHLTNAIKQVLTTAIHHKGSTLRDYVDAQGNPGNFQNLHLVYQRHNHPCPICKTPIRQIRLSNRSTHFCPRCQKIKPPKR